MKKLFQKIAAMAITYIMCISSVIPTMAATSQDYVPTIDLNNGIAMASVDTTGQVTTPGYGTSQNGMTILAVDDKYNQLEKFDTSKLVVGNMGGVNAPVTKTYNNVNYTFSHYEYATSVRNYVASYNQKFEFYVDPPMTILAVYTTGTPNPPAGPIVGMYKDPDVKEDNGQKLTFFYMNEAASTGTNISNVKANVTLGRSQVINTAADSEETFSTQANNIYSQNNNIQYIVASAIKDGKPINIDVTANATVANAQIKTWDFGTSAFDEIVGSSSDYLMINDISVGNVSGVNNSSITVNNTVVNKTETFNKGIKFDVASGSNIPQYDASNNGVKNGSRGLVFKVNKGDVVDVYAKGNQKTDSTIGVSNLTYKTGDNSSAGNSGGSGTFNRYTANDTGYATLYFTGQNGFFYCVKVNPYEINEGGSVTPPTPSETVTQIFTINPNVSGVKVGNSEITNNGSLTLTKDQQYTVTAPNGYEVVSVNGVNGNSFTASTDNATIAIVLAEVKNTVTATVNVTPNAAKIKINNVEYSNGAAIELTVGQNYEVVSADTTKYTVETVNGASTNSFIATANTNVINVVLAEVTQEDPYYDVFGNGSVDDSTGLQYNFQDAKYNGKKAHASGQQASGAVYGMLDATDNYLIYSTADGLTITDNSSASNAAYIPLGKTLSEGVVTINGNVKLSSDCKNGINIIRFGSSGIGIRYDGSKIVLSDDKTYTSNSIAYTAGNDIEFTWVIDLTNKKATLTVGGSTIEQTFTTAQSSDLLVFNTGSTATFDTSCKYITIKHTEGTVNPPVPETITQTFNITPNNQSVTINGQSVTNGDKLTLDKNTSYTITPPSGYTVSPTTFTTGSSDGTTNITLTSTAPTTVEANISVSPTEAKIKINGTEYSNGGKITLTIGSSYTVTSADTSAYNLDSVTPGTTFTASADTTAISAKLTAVSTPPTPSGDERVWNFTTNSTLSSYVYSSSNKSVSTDDGFMYQGNGSNDKILKDGTAPYTNYLQFGGGGSATGRHFEIANVAAGDIVTIIYGKSTTSSRTLTFVDGSETNSITDLEKTSSLATPAATPITYTVKNDGTLKFFFSNNNVSIFEVSIKPSTPPTTGTVTVNVKNQNGAAITGATLTGISGFTESNGVYTAKGVEPGTYTVTASKNGVSGSTESFAVEAGGKYTKDIVLNFNSGSIAITVNDGTNPITNAAVTASGLTFTHSGNGVYTATGVADGTYNVSVSNGSETRSVNVTVLAGSTEKMTVSFMDTHMEAMNKMQEYLNIILARDVSQPKWNTESSRFNTNNWHYVNGAMATALLDLYEATGETRYSKFATDTLNLNISSNGSFPSSSGISSFIDSKSQLDGVREMTDFDRLYKLTGDSRYNTAADYIYDHVLSPIDRITESEDPNAVGSFSHKTENYKNQIWLDGFFMGFPFYMQYGVNKNDQTMIDDVYTQYKNLYNVDRDSATGLYYHGYNGNTSNIVINGHTWASHSHTDSLWLRAMAWLAMSYVDTLEFMPEGTQKEDMKKWFREYMDAVVKYQDSTTGMWRQVVDAGDVSITANGHTFDNYFETSGSSGMAAALMKGYRLGYLDINHYNAGVKAFDGICENKLYYSDTAESEIYNYTTTKQRLDWITPWQVTSDNNNGSENINKYMILKDICRVAGLTSTSTTNYGNTIYRDGTRDYYLQEFRVDNDGKAIAPLVRAYSEVLIHENGSKKVTIK